MVTAVCEDAHTLCKRLLLGDMLRGLLHRDRRHNRSCLWSQQ